LANKGYTDQILNTLPTETRGPVTRAFQYVLDNLRFGLQSDRTRAENMQGYRLDATTHVDANTEFSVSHGLGQAPSLVLPILILDVGNSFVPLTVTRAADASRIYLRSSSTGAPISLYVE
jgi:hypothetical protein